MRNAGGPLALIGFVVAALWLAWQTGRGSVLVVVLAALLLAGAALALRRGALGPARAALSSRTRPRDRPGITCFPAMPPDPRPQPTDDERRDER